MNKRIYLFLITFLILIPFKVIYAQDSATDSSDSVREKVQEKVNQALNTPIAYIGSVTDLSEKTLQISKYTSTKDKSGEIQQVSVGDGTVLVNVVGNSKTVKFSDVAIGDFIVAMGYANGNSVLEAKRILITQALEPSKRKSVFGTISEIDVKTVTIKNQNTQTVLKFPKSWIGPEIKELNEGDQIIATGVSDNDLEVRTIKLIPQDTTSSTPESETTPTPSE